MQDMVVTEAEPATPPVPIPGALVEAMLARLTPAEQALWAGYLADYNPRSPNHDVDMACIFMRGLQMTLAWHRKQDEIKKQRGMNLVPRLNAA